jgi:hypothetical protein
MALCTASKEYLWVLLPCPIKLFPLHGFVRAPAGMAVVNQAHAQGAGLGPCGLPSARLRAPLARLPLAAWGL